MPVAGTAALPSALPSAGDDLPVGGFAAGGLVLIGFAVLGVLDPLRGALAQSGAVLLVVANSARILRFAKDERQGNR